MKLSFKDNAGQAVLISVIIMGSILLSVTTIAGYLTMQKIKIAGNATNSMKALYAADAGLEFELYKHLHPSSTDADPIFSNGASSVHMRQINPATGAGEIRSLGTAGRSSRAFNILINEAQ